MTNIFCEFIKMTLVWIVIRRIDAVLTDKNSVGDMTIQDLARLSHPQEYGRCDMHYKTVWSTEFDSLFETLSLRNVSKLHISVKPIGWARIDITNIFKFRNLTELWIVQSTSSKLMQIGIIFQGILKEKLMYLQKLHQKFRYNHMTTLSAFLSTLPNLKVLELTGLRYTGSLYDMMASLRKMPLIVLKLNQFESMEI